VSALSSMPLNANKRIARCGDASATSDSHAGQSSPCHAFRRVSSDVRAQRGRKLLRLTFPRELHLPILHNDVSGFASPSVPTDSDGDAVVARRPRACDIVDGSARDFELHVQSSRSSSVANCGEQVWGASLLLAEYLWSVRHSLGASTVLEMGAGLAVPSACISGFCTQVLVSDINKVRRERLFLRLCCIYTHVLCGLQAALASARSMCMRACCSCNCTFLLLDWRQPLMAAPIAEAAAASCDTPTQPFDFSRVNIVIASDVAYDPALTQSFFVALRALLLAAAPHAVALVTLERRVNFSESMRDVVALDADVFADVFSFCSTCTRPSPLTHRHSMPRAAASIITESFSMAFPAARCRRCRVPRSASSA
jgi:hypothetical protein